MTWSNTMTIHEIQVGEELPAFPIPITTTLITSGAIATRDYFPGHHDKDAAQQLGSPHVFMNILTTSALVQRYVEQWAGPGARFKAVKVKLGAPNYPSDTMVFKGEVTAIEPSTSQVSLLVRGSNSLGNHVTSEVLLVLPTDTENTHV